MPETKRPSPPQQGPGPARKRAGARRKTGKEDPATEPPLNVLMVASEAHPFAKTGGLAEVVGSLPDALARLGHSVTVVLPRYRGVHTGGAPGVPVPLRLGATTQHVTFFTRAMRPGVTAVLVDAPALFDREGLYGSSTAPFDDNAWRFAVLSLAALEYARGTGVRPSILHAHDWQAGLVPVFQKVRFADDPVVGGVPAVFTIHNLAFQGLFPWQTAADLGLPPEVLGVDAMEYWGHISCLKGGINYSEKITTVSPTYARDILQPEHGFGFHGVLARRAADLSGILNGIDVERWNPAADELIPAAFSAKDLSGKTAAKRALLDTFGIAQDEAMRRPVIGMITRLTDQKGLDLVEAAAAELMALDASWVMLGSGERRYEDLWRDLARRHPGRVATVIGFDERLAHLIEAGADIFLMPSKFEPCGLNQMYSLRYGTVPVVRATGGLADTVRDADQAGARGTGFTFTDYVPGAIVGAVRRALDAYGRPGRWKRIQTAGMREDHSWDVSAREYVKVYRRA